MKNISTLFILCLVTTPTFAWSPFGPKNYNECIIENMKGTTDSLAARHIALACANEFPDSTPSYTPPEPPPKCKQRQLTTAEKSLVKYGEAKITGYRSNVLTMPVYNGNDKIEIHAVTIELSADNIKPPERYRTSIKYVGPIAPLSTGEITTSIQVVPSKNSTLAITSIETCD